MSATLKYTIAAETRALGLIEIRGDEFITYDKVVYSSHDSVQREMLTLAQMGGLSDEQTEFQLDTWSVDKDGEPHDILGEVALTRVGFDYFARMIEHTPYRDEVPA